jgi:hypothetical protein
MYNESPLAVLGARISTIFIAWASRLLNPAVDTWNCINNKNGTK